MKYLALSFSDTSKNVPSRPARGAWVEIVVVLVCASMLRPSRPARGAWVEILVNRPQRCAKPVAPRKGRVG